MSPPHMSTLSNIIYDYAPAPSIIILQLLFKQTYFNISQTISISHSFFQQLGFSINFDIILMPKLTQADYDGFKQAFELFDKDGSGSISAQEMKQVFKQLRMNVKEGELKKIMKNFDEDGDNNIQFEQFLMVVAEHLEEPESQGWIFEVFQTIDEDCDGIISKRQLIKAIQAFGLQVQEKEVELMMEEGDPLGEGGINYQQFLRILKICMKIRRCIKIEDVSDMHDFVNSDSEDRHDKIILY